jgi:hypothetical protein
MASISIPLNHLFRWILWSLTVAIFRRLRLMLACTSPQHATSSQAQVGHAPPLRLMLMLGLHLATPLSLMLRLGMHLPSSCPSIACPSPTCTSPAWPSHACPSHAPPLRLRLGMHLPSGSGFSSQIQVVGRPKRQALKDDPLLVRFNLAGCKLSNKIQLLMQEGWKKVVRRVDFTSLYFSTFSSSRFLCYWQVMAARLFEAGEEERMK